MTELLQRGCLVCRKHRGEFTVAGGAIYENRLVYISHAPLWGDEAEIAQLAHRIRTSLDERYG